MNYTLRLYQIAAVEAGVIECDRPNSYLLRHSDGRTLWWPKSKLQIMAQNGRTITARIPKWLAINKGMTERPAQMALTMGGGL